MSNCKGSIEATFEVIVGKWKPIILYHIIEGDVLRFSELQRRIPGITKKMLTTQLRDLEAHGIVYREVYPVVPPKVEYSLTEYGKEIIPLLRMLHQWGIKHIQYLKSINK